MLVKSLGEFTLEDFQGEEIRLTKEISKLNFLIEQHELQAISLTKFTDKLRSSLANSEELTDNYLTRALEAKLDPAIQLPDQEIAETMQAIQKNYTQLSSRDKKGIENLKRGFFQLEKTRKKIEALKKERELPLKDLEQIRSKFNDTENFPSITTIPEDKSQRKLRALTDSRQGYDTTSQLWSALCFVSPSFLFFEGMPKLTKGDTLTVTESANNNDGDYKVAEKVKDSTNGWLLIKPDNSSVEITEEPASFAKIKITSGEEA